jgi:hypothetical protein
MGDLTEMLSKELDVLRQARDEARVRLHLAKADAQQEWSKLEDKWLQVESELKNIGSGAKRPMQEIESSARRLVDELRDGYQRLKQKL